MKSTPSIILPSASTISAEYLSAERLDALHQQFEAEQFVKLPNFLNECAYDVVEKSLNELHAERVRKDFVMPGLNTERKMSVIGGRQVASISLPLIALYGNHELRKVLSAIAGKYLHTVDHEEEYIVVNFLDGHGDTHGWHTDDPEYALILITEVPPDNCGGQLNYIPNWQNFCEKKEFELSHRDNAAICEAHRLGMIKSSNLVAGDAYFLNASKALHRVTPIIGNGQRKALNMAFDARKFRQYGETAHLLYAS